MTTLKSSSASALHLVPHAQEQAYHEDHQYVVSGSQIKREKAIKQEFEIERNQRAHQRSQVDPHQYLDLEQAVNSASLQKDQEIEAPAHYYTAGRTIQPIEVLEDVRFRRLYEIV